MKYGERLLIDVRFDVKCGVPCTMHCGVRGVHTVGECGVQL